MTKPLRCLLIEDSEDDAALVARSLRAGDFDLTLMRVDTPEAMRDALNRQSWDIVLSDYRLPRFSGKSALEQLKASGLDLPFIIVSGTIGDEIAAEAMKVGAHDYILKDNLERLVPAVERELRDAAERRRLRQAEAALKDERALFNDLASTIPDHIYFKDLDSRFVRINDAMARLFGLQHAEEAVGKTDFDFFGEEHARQAYIGEQAVMRTGTPIIDLEEKETWPDGRITWVTTTKVPQRNADGAVTGLIGISRDITQRKRADAQLRLLSAALSSAANAIVITNRDGVIEWVNASYSTLTGYTSDEAIGHNPRELVKSGKHDEEFYRDLWTTILAGRVRPGQGGHSRGPAVSSRRRGHRQSAVHRGRYFGSGTGSACRAAQGLLCSRPRRPPVARRLVSGDAEDAARRRTIGRAFGFLGLRRCAVARAHRRG